MLTWLKKRIALIVCDWIQVDPNLLTPASAYGSVGEILIRGGRVWVNVDGKCVCRCVLQGSVLVRNDDVVTQGMPQGVTRTSAR